ncbi:MAG: hypothetical protein KAQ68_01520 [Clostridiales bacterium]|nr:hypothetical protein [Clostridiales bacterium]
MIVHSKRYSYTIAIEDDFSFVETLLSTENTFFVIDQKVYEIYRQQLFSNIPAEKLMLIKAVEENKTIDTALKICERMTEFPAKRNAHLISFGGGIVQDITGFVASILYRGIYWTFIPTTLLAACDSCIGSKTSLNYKKYKNLLGTFYPPMDIYICSRFFQTLSEKDLMSGLGEVVKFNIMAGIGSLTSIEKDIDGLLQKDENLLNHYVESSLMFKKDFVEEDEYDEGIRIKLNFAHTFGHAIETVTQYVIPHGTAVAIGTIIANHISVKRGLMKDTIAQRCEAVLRKIIKTDEILLQYPIQSFVDVMRKDKKQISKHLTAVLIYGDTMELILTHDLMVEEISDAVKYYETHNN